VKYEKYAFVSLDKAEWQKELKKTSKSGIARSNLKQFF